jgi:hypothetical protein
LPTRISTPLNLTISTTTTFFSFGFNLFAQCVISQIPAGVYLSYQESGGHCVEIESLQAFEPLAAKIAPSLKISDIAAQYRKHTKGGPRTDTESLYL